MTWMLRTSGYDIQVHAYPAKYGVGEHAFWEAACGLCTPTELLTLTDEVTPTCFACLLPFGSTEADKLLARSRDLAEAQAAELAEPDQL